MEFEKEDGDFLSQMIKEVNWDKYENADNFRLAIRDDFESEQAYYLKRDKGCCGYRDFIWDPSFVVKGAPSGKTYLFGFNYGH